MQSRKKYDSYSNWLTTLISISFVGLIAAVKENDELGKRRRGRVFDVFEQMSSVLDEMSQKKSGN